MRFNACVNEIAPFRPFAVLSRVVSPLTVVVELEVSPQNEMGNPQGIQVFAFERHGLSEDFVSFRALCGVQSSPLEFAPNCTFVCGTLRGKGTGRDSVFQVCVLLG